MKKDFLSLEVQVYNECIEMANFAFSTGISVSGSILKTLSSMKNEFHRESGEIVHADGDAPKNETAEGPAGPGISPEMIEKLTKIHNQLSELVAPAKPGTLLLLSQEKKKTKFFFLGPVPLIRRMMILAAFSLALFVALGVTPFVDTESINKSIFDSDGLSLLLNLLFLFTASSIGALFANMFKVSKYIANNTFDSKMESSYWIRYFMGLMAGMIIAELIPLDFSAYESGGSLEALAKPTLALLGGFSADLVNRIISSLIEAVASIVKGDAKELLAMKEEMLKKEVANKDTENKINLVSKLSKLGSQIDQSKNPEAIKNELMTLSDSLLPGGGD